MRELAPHNTATSLQVVAGVLGGMVWALRNPRAGVVEPDDIVEQGRHSELLSPGGLYAMLYRHQMDIVQHDDASQVEPDLAPVGKWVAPRPKTTKTGEQIYSDSILFRRALNVRLNTPPGLLSIKGELRCQACTEELCWPPAKIGVSTSIAVVSKTKE